METKLALKDETIEKIQDLIQLNLDSKQGFVAASEKIDNSGIANDFRRFAKERENNASELQTYVALNNERPKDSGTMKGAAHRLWMKALATISKADTKVILREAEEGEDEIKHAYEDVLKEIPGNALSAVLHSQYTKVKAGHDHVRGLRDQRS